MGRGAGTLHGGTELGRWQAAMLWLAVCCVAMMPSVFRGGAEIPHPHSFFQFWLSGPETAFDHHRSYEGAMAEDGHAHHDLATATSPCGAGVSDLAAACAAPTAGASGKADEPHVSPMTAPGGTVELLGAIVLAFAIVAAVGVRSWRFPTLRGSWRHRFPSPESPPPRAYCV